MAAIFYTASCAVMMILFCLGISLPAYAQMSSEPWSFSPQNRASIAALMKQTEEQQQATAVVQPADTLICGGGTGNSAAAGNSTCVILNNATGMIQLDQDETGDQNATSTSSVSVQTEEGADEVAAALGVLPQGEQP